jgi:hypothetical protein
MDLRSGTPDGYGMMKVLKNRYIVRPSMTVSESETFLESTTDVRYEMDGENIKI